jgi:hypothetical protein
MLTSVDDKQTFDTAADEYNKLASTKLAKDSGINLSTLTDLKEKEIKTHTKSIESAQEKRELKIAETKENEVPINKAIRETTNLDESFAKKIAQQLKKKTKNKWGMMIGIVLTNGEQTPLADQIIAAVILEPQSFTIKKITRDNTDIHTILCSESIQDIEDIEDLKSDLLNNYKLQLYKKILDIITRYSNPVSDSVEQNVAVKVLPRNMTQADRINVLKRYNSRRLQSATSRGGKKRTKKRNHKKTTNEEPKPKRKQEQTRKKKRHSITSDS